MSSNWQHSHFDKIYIVARLRLTQSPRDLRVPSLGQRAEFRCSTSDPSVSPFWLFNGEPIFTHNRESYLFDFLG